MWRAPDVFRIGREYSKARRFNIFFRVYFAFFGAPEIGAKIRTKLAIREITKYPFRKLLDAGCGKGYLTFWVANRYKTTQVLGLDIDKLKLQDNLFLKESFRLSNLDYCQADITSFRTEDKYDLIVISDVLEHIEDDLLLLKNLRACIEGAGRLVILVPRPVQHTFFAKAQEYIVEDHVREGYTEDEISSKLYNAGFSVLKITRSYNFFESLASQIGNIFSSKVFIYAMLLPFISLISCIPQSLIGGEYISNTMIVVAEPRHEPIK